MSFLILLHRISLIANVHSRLKKTIYLSKIDYENFYTDMVADRQFIEDYGYLCSAGTPMKCLLVKTRQASDGILVVPEEKCYVGWAAYLAKDE